jgi:hypothetical protein
MIRRGAPEPALTRTSAAAPLLLAALLGTAACDAGRLVDTPPPPPPALLETGVAANPLNVLSAVVSVRARDAAHVIVEYGASAGELDQRSADAPLRDGEVVVPLLGLLPETHYRLRVVAYGPGGSAAGDLLELTTGALPPDLPAFTAGGTDPTPGYVVFAAGGFGLVIDNAGRVVWYRGFENGPGLNFHRQPNGHFYARPPPLDPLEPVAWHELDVLGRVLRTFGCARGLQTRFHDLIVESDDSYWVLCDQTRTLDLSAIGGFEGAEVTATTVQHVSAGGELLFAWNPFDHFDIADLDAANRSGPTVNWTHGNALDLDAQRNLLVSFRNLSEITKIDTNTGAVVWRLGGARNEFAFEGTELPAFHYQHSVRVTGPGSILLLDNLGNAHGSRAERYTLDEANHSARLVAAYGPDGIVAQLGGTAQALPGGRTLVTFGSAGRVEEYDDHGAVVWRIEGEPGYVFNAQRIAALVGP